MRNVLIVGVAVVVAVAVSLTYYWWAGDRTESDAIVLDAGAAGANARGTRGERERGEGFNMREIVALAWGQGGDSFSEAVAALGEASLTPDFVLTPEQKQKIQGIRDGVKIAQEKWQKEHAEEFRRIEDEFRKARDNDDAQRGAWREIAVKRQKLMATAPKPDEAVKQLRAVLTPEQLKVLDARLAERKAGGEDVRIRVLERGGAGPGQAGGERRQGRAGRADQAAPPATQGR